MTLNVVFCFCYIGIFILNDSLVTVHGNLNSTFQSERVTKSFSRAVRTAALERERGRVEIKYYNFVLPL